jgi:TPR repeat protein
LRNSSLLVVVLVAAAAVLAGGAFYALRLDHERQVLGLQRQLEQARAALSEARALAEERRRAREEPVAAAPAVPGPRVDPQALYEQAAGLEGSGKGPEAVQTYIRAARAASGRAALRLGEIYDKGIAGVARNYGESLKWYNAARVLGEDVPLLKR